MDSTNSRETLENRAYEALKTAIVTGVYPPGAQIVEELAASQLAVSRSPVRSAIKRLQAEGFLERYPNKRIYVAMADAEKTKNALYIREALEGMASRLAALRPEESVPGWAFRFLQGVPGVTMVLCGKRSRRWTAAPGRATPPASIWQRCSCTAPFSPPAKIPSWNAWPPIFWIRSAYSATEAW